MNLKLIIAEKPSVANCIAQVVGATDKQRGYLQGCGYIVSWCLGHLVGLAEPAAYDPALKKWSLDTLPILPPVFQYEVYPDTAVQFEILQGLMERPDIDELIAATDAGREGELIFRLVYNATGCKKPFSRLWISSMEPASIREGLQNLRPSADYDNLFLAALCRQKADWLLGLNLTRYYTKAYDRKLPCGRVQTPTLNLVVQRQREIENFVPTPYYIVTADLGTFKATRRSATEAEAKIICHHCADKKGIVTSLERKETVENPPKLFNLTALQKEANRLLGYTAQQTLDYTQSLYESGLATYPRSPSRYITSDMAQPTLQLVKRLAEDGVLPPETLADYQVGDANVEKVVSNAKVEDHPAILPTEAVTAQRIASLPSGEQGVLLLLCRQLLAAVYRPSRSVTTKIAVTIDDTQFEATGRETLDAGWQNVYAALATMLGVSPRNTAVSLPSFTEGQALPPATMTYTKRQTQPPEAYTDETLLSAMECAGKTLQDEEQREAMKDRGLGTEATRAATLEGLSDCGYITRKGKKILPTKLGCDFIDLVTEKMRSPELTGQWEKALADIQRGNGGPAAFMADVEGFLRDFIPQARANLHPEDKERFSSHPSLGVCPCCGRPVVEYPKSYSCESGKNGCGFTIWKQIAQKSISAEDAKQLLATGETRLIQGFISKKTGKKFDAHLILKEDHTVGFRFPPKKTSFPAKKTKRRR